jgi:hypothetical protein
MMENPGRESAKDNDLFFTCSLIDYIARKTKNTRADTVNALGKRTLRKSMIWRMSITVTI